MIGYIDICFIRFGYKVRLREFCMVINFLEFFNFSEVNFVNIIGIIIVDLICLGFVIMSNGWLFCLNMFKMFGGMIKNKFINEVLSV